MLKLKVFLSLCLLSLPLISLPASAQNAASPASSPEGLWLTENERSVISVKECAEGLCGTIHWIIDGGMKFDSENEDETLQGRPMCGLKILWGFHQQDAMIWIDGNIYKADEGDLYNASMQMLPKGNLLVRGYVGMTLFGKSQTWTPVSAKDYPKCKAAKM